MAGNDVFGYQRNTSPAAVVTTTETLITFGGGEGGGGNANQLIGALVQSWNAQYANNITELYELGSSKIYWVRGRPTGTGQAARVLGFIGFRMFPPEAFNPCNKGGTTMVISSNPQACDVEGPAQNRGEGIEQTKVAITLYGVVITNLTFTAQVADTRFHETFAWRFSSMEVEDQ